MMSRRQEASHCVLCVAPHNGPEFQTLCDALKRNEPAVTTVATHRSVTPAGYGRQLGEALLSNSNSVVSEIDLHLSFLLSEHQGLSTNSATALLQWMEKSSSLRTVTLRCKSESLEMIDVILLKNIVKSMMKNPNIRAFHSHENNFPVSYTEYLSTPNTGSLLESLTIHISHELFDLDLTSAVQALVSLSRLHVLSLACSMEFLKLLPTSTTSLLRELHLDFQLDDVASDIAHFASILSSSNQLMRVTLELLNIDSEIWEHIRLALQSNPSILHFVLKSCRFKREAGPRFINYMQSSNAEHQHVRILELSDTKIDRATEIANAPQVALPAAADMSQMLLGSSLQHVSLDLSGWAKVRAAEFFAALSSNPSAMRLQSMHLRGATLWDMSLYLSTNIHIRHFIFTFMPEDGGDRRFSVPVTFLHALRRNGSLHTVEFKNDEGLLYQPNTMVSRFIDAFMSRNRELPDVAKKALQVASTESGATDAIGNNDEINAMLKTRFPALCLTSQQAPATSPNTTLRGLLASLDKLGTVTSGHLQGKRAAAAASLEDSCD